MPLREMNIISKRDRILLLCDDPRRTLEFIWVNYY